jgi:Tol biopolymer transport system component
MKLVDTCSRCWIVPVLGSLGVAALASPLAGQSLKLNDPLARELRGGAVSDFHFTPSATRVVYRADRETYLQFELFSRPLDGSAPSLRLNGPMPAEGDVGVNGNIQGSFAVGAGDRVVYLASETIGRYELFSVPADGSATRVRISEFGDPIKDYALDPAGMRVVYRQGPYTGASELVVVPVDGSAAPLHLAPGQNAQDFWIAPDGATLAFSASVPSSDDRELYLVPLDGSAAPRLLTRTHPPGFSLAFVFFDDVVFTPDGSRLVYNEVENFDDDLTPELYSVRLDASQPSVRLSNGPFHPGPFVLGPAAPLVRVAFQINGAFVSIGVDGTQLVQLSPAGWMPRSAPLVSGSDVFFTAFQAGTGSTLFRAPIDGSQAAAALFPVGGAIVSFAPVNATTLGFIRMDGSSKQLYAVPRSGGTPVPLHANVPAGQGPIAFTPHPDGQRLLYRGDNDTTGVFELYVVPVDASHAPTKLNAPLASNADVREWLVTPDEDHVTFRAGLDGLGQVDLLLTELDGSTAPFQLNEATPGATVGDVTSFGLTPDRATVVYRADQEHYEDFDLYARASDGSGPARLLSASVASVLPAFALAPDGERVVFPSQAIQFALHAAPLAGGAPVTLETSAVAFPPDFAVSPDGTRCVYRRGLSGNLFELRSVALDGLSPSVRLHAPLLTGSSVTRFRLAGDVVVFLADLSANDVFELYAVPLTGGTPVKLGPTPVSGGDVTDFEIDPAGLVAVFLADARVNGRVELFRAPLDGSFASTRVSAALPTTGDVTDFAFTPDGRHVIYRADARADQRFELFRVPLGGPPPPHRRPGAEPPARVTLLTPLPPGAAVQADWSLAPDGSQVVYRANAEAGARFELYRVFVDASAAPAKLNGPLATSGDVLAFAIAPDSSRVAYLADQRVDGVNELFSAPLGGGPALALDDLPAFADATAFSISPDSAHVVFLADAATDGVAELFRVPLDGSGPAWRLNPFLAPGQSVQADFVALDGGALYRADQEEDEVIELFLGRPLVRATGHARPR